MRTPIKALHIKLIIALLYQLLQAREIHLLQLALLIHLATALLARKIHIHHHQQVKHPYTDHHNYTI
jgi:hypothetical protein